MKKRVFFQNAAIMTATSLILRTIGIFFRIYVSNRIGAEGMGLYQVIISVYILVSSFATSGLTTAVTRLCTEELACGTTRSVKRILYTCIWLSIVVGCASGLAVYSGSRLIAEICLQDIRAGSSLRILAFSLPFMGVSSCIKGYFMARRKVTGSSFAQILEQIVRIGVIVAVLEISDVTTIEGACFTVLFGDTVAEAVSCLFMGFCYVFDKRRLDKTNTGNTTYPICKRIFSIALPITGGRYLNSGLRTVENITVPNALECYTQSKEAALSLFGKLKGMALPLIFFPSSFLTAFTALLIPEISEASALKNERHVKRTVERAVHITLLSSYLIGGVFFTIAIPLSNLLYHDEEIGRMLRFLAFLTPCMYLESVVVGILKGLDQQSASLFYSVLDSVSRIALIWFCVPFYGLIGFYLVMIISNVLTCGLNFRKLCMVSHMRFRVNKWIVKPCIAVVTGIVVAQTVKKFVLSVQYEDVVYCVLGTVIVSAVYIVLLPFLGCIEKEDLILVKPKRKAI